jgi:hypothetical protein
MEGTLRTLKILENSTMLLSYTSPIEPIVEVALDVILILTQAVRSDFRALVPRNSEIGFSEFEQDVLGNPKQFKMNPFSKDVIFGPNPTAEKIFKNFSEYLILFKRSLLIPFLEESKEESVKDALNKQERRFMNMIADQKFALKQKLDRSRRNRHFANVRRQKQRRR